MPTWFTKRSSKTGEKLVNLSDTGNIGGRSGTFHLSVDVSLFGRLREDYVSIRFPSGLQSDSTLLEGRRTLEERLVERVAPKSHGDQ